MFLIHDLIFHFFCSTVSKIRSRHELLQGTIGTFREEDSAYQLVRTLSLALPITVVLGAAVDGLCAYLYMHFFHPWKDILFYEDKEEEQEGLKKQTQVSGM